MMKKGWIFFLLPIFFFVTAIAAIIAVIPVVLAESNSAIQSQETNFPGVIAELTQCKRKGGVLTVKVRVVNNSPKAVRMYWRDPKKNAYLMDEANGKKYFLLKDAKGEYIYSGDPGTIGSQSRRFSWFKFPAPPEEVKKISIALPDCMIFEDIPIQDN
jgi:hypothetical protein